MPQCTAVDLCNKIIEINTNFTKFSYKNMSAHNAGYFAVSHKELFEYALEDLAKAYMYIVAPFSQSVMGQDDYVKTYPSLKDTAIGMLKWLKTKREPQLVESGDIAS